MARHLPNWIEGYLAYTAESESPEVFHLWCGLSAIAGALRRKVSFDMGYFTVYPNLFTVLVSPPGRCKKSTAMRVARSLLNRVPGINFTVDSTTRERLIQDLSQCFVDEHSSMTAYSSEFASLVTNSGMDMVIFLTDIYDSPDEWTHKTKGGGTNKIRAPFLNLIGGTTPDWIASSMPLDTIGIGLTSRTIFVYADEPRAASPFPTLSPAQKELFVLLAEDLAEISAIQGRYEFTPEARQVYIDWYMKREEEREYDPRIAGYYERKPIHLLKLCIIVAASRRQELTITLDDYNSAMFLLSQCEELMPRVFANVGRNPLNQDIEQALAMLLARPDGVGIGEILNTFKHNVSKDQLVEVLDTLITVGEVQLGPNAKYYAINRK